MQVDPAGTGSEEPEKGKWFVLGVGTSPIRTVRDIGADEAIAQPFDGLRETADRLGVLGHSVLKARKEIQVSIRPSLLGAALPCPTPRRVATACREARAYLVAVAVTRDVKEVLFYSPSKEHVAQFQRNMATVVRCGWHQRPARSLSVRTSCLPRWTQ